jgi:hypothetical protein
MGLRPRTVLGRPYETVGHDGLWFIRNTVEEKKRSDCEQSEKGGAAVTKRVGIGQVVEFEDVNLATLPWVVAK